ncbi:MAG TPA: D-glycero-beta-D-manno-heptose 1-phosphate adenylyltransferase [Syntrophobacteraceae bacterium]|nr:D-glycero-beta-D-manno-heptose 1-phosphate adenylyltransferase [Syntrophobacteraceae bacterium]
MKARDKIKNIEELDAICRTARERRLRVVFTNGCFDLLHVGHVRYLEAARSQGDLLVVAVNSDASVRQIKGDLRPIIQQAQRCELVAALHCVDYVCVFDTPDPLPLITRLQPSILVKGADWSLDKTVGAAEVQRAGGKVVHIQLVPDASSTRIIERVLERFREKDQGTGRG